MTNIYFVISLILNVVLVATVLSLVFGNLGVEAKKGSANNAQRPREKAAIANKRGANKRGANKRGANKRGANKKEISAAPTGQSIAEKRAQQKDDYKLDVQKFESEQNGILTGRTVLVADDDETNIDVLVGMLEIMGLTNLVTAENGEEALEYAQQKEFDIIYMDIQMPKKTGIDASRAIRSYGKNRKTPIIAITGFSRIVNSQMCKDAGMNEFFQKPVDFKRLESATRSLLLAGKAGQAA